jgi:glycosyltransferase involved in cell wall biosynthesis
LKQDHIASAGSICIIVPTYNNAKTLGTLIGELQLFELPVIVINDGSNDESLNILQRFPKIHLITYLQNQGKGFALRKGFAKAIELGFNYGISIDSDGQHFSSDIPVFIEALKDNPGTLIIGARNMSQSGVPAKSSFGNRFSNFWFWFETGIRLPDTQSGYRLYPLWILRNTRFYTKKFEFEIEVIVRAAWKGIPIIPVPVSVYYPPPGVRVSHFRPFVDFTRISILNTVLVFIAIFYIKPRDLLKRLFVQKKWKEILLNELFERSQSDSRKSVSIGFGIFMGIVPIWGFQLIVAIFMAVLFRLNKGLVFVFAHISIPPMIPLIIFASYKFGAFWISGSQDMIFSNSLTISLVRSHLKQYLIGSISLATAAGLTAFVVSYILLKVFRNKNRVIIN